MAKYLVETYYTCTFKVNHYLDDINETELKNLEKRDDGKFEVLDVNLIIVKQKVLIQIIIKSLKVKR
jgi:ribonucleoside-diphosphate reductase alpha chain